MKKIKSKILKARSLISIKTYKHPMIFVISIMILLNIIILAIAALIALRISNEFSNFIDAFVNGSLKWMLTPNAILLIRDPGLSVLAVVVLVIGMILFTGSIIALTTNAIKDYFQMKKSGSGKIYLEKHVVILNWNNKVPELVVDLMHIEEAQIQVVILAEIDKVYAEKQIINAINNSKHKDEELKNLNVLVKSGNPLLHSDLNDISISKASSILIMNKDMHQNVLNNMTKSDLNVIKTILTLGVIEFIYDPPIVAEIKRIETKEKIMIMSKVIQTLHEHKIMPICFDRRLGLIIAQTIINPTMEDVYLSLFSFTGSEVYNVKNMDFEDCLNNCNYAIPVSKYENELFVLSLNDKTKSSYKKQKYNSKKLKLDKLIKPKNFDVYIIGDNNKLSFIMQSFNEYKELYNNEFNAKYINNDDLSTVIDEINKSEKLIIVVLLSDESLEIENLDANVIENLIYLQGNIKKSNVKIIVELLDPKNDHIIKDFDIENTIISNKIISLLLSKLALFKETAPFYENLLTIKDDITGLDNQNIFIVKANTYILDKLPINFKSVKEFLISIYQSSNKEYIPIGYIRESKLNIFEGDMSLDKIVEIKSQDEIVLYKI